MSDKFALELSGKLAIVQPPEAKPMLVRLRQHKNRLRGVLQDNYAADREINLQPDEILSVFPHKLPQFGRAYNVHIEPRISMEKFSRWGNITYYRELSKTERKNFHHGLELTYRQFVRKFNLRFLLPINIEVRNPKGKQVGMYHPPRGERESFIEINPTSFVTNPAEPDDRHGGAKYIKRITAHELTHPLWQLYLPDELKTRWVKLYHSFARLRELTKDDLERIRLDLIGSKIPITEYRKAAEEETRLFVDAVLLWIKKIHHLDIKSLNLLLMQGDKLTDYWPTSKIHLSELKIPVTKYAAKNPEECCCESFALIAMKQKLPRSVVKLVQRSIKAVQPK